MVQLALCPTISLLFTIVMTFPPPLSFLQKNGSDGFRSGTWPLLRPSLSKDPYLPVNEHVAGGTGDDNGLDGE